MLYQLVQLLADFIENPTPILDLPENDRLLIENELYDLAELLEDARCGVLVKP